MVQYEDYVAEQVRRLYPAASELRALWRSADGRDEVTSALDVRGITVRELAERTGLEEADPFDLLVHVAWNGALTSRRDRAERVRREHLNEFTRLADNARAAFAGLIPAVLAR